MDSEISPMWLAGRWEAGREETIVVRDPGSGEAVGQVPSATLADAEAALACAARAAAVAQRTPVHERMRVLRAVADRAAADAEAFARLIATEGIKTLREARLEAQRCVETLRLSAEEARRLGGETINFDQRPGSEAKTGWWRRDPAGVVLAITPYNDPLNLVAHKIGPALAGGNAVILKPHKATPLSALRLAAAFDAAGLAPGVLQVITGDSRIIGDALVGDPRVRIVSFTGGPVVGRHLVAVAGLKRVLMELGGNAPAIVLPDADLPAAVDACVSGAFWAAGQNCLHVQRIVAHADVYAQVRERFVRQAARLAIGPKLDESTDMGPQINAAAVRRLHERVESAQRAGARLLCGGRSEGSFYLPTVLENVPPDHVLYREEIFGPVTLLEKAASADDAIERANATDYGLQAAVFTRDLKAAFRVSQALAFGGVMINESSDYRIDQMPFGGMKSSGLGREGVRSTIEAMTEPKVVCINTA